MVRGSPWGVPGGSLGSSWEPPGLRGPLNQSKERPGSARGVPREAGNGGPGVPGGIKGGLTNKIEQQETLYHALGPLARRILFQRQQK